MHESIILSAPIMIRATTSKYSSGCENLVPAPPHTASGETFICTRRSLPKGPLVGAFVGLSINSEPGSGPLKPTNGFVYGTRIILRDVWCCGVCHEMNYKIGWIKISLNSRSKRIEVLRYLLKSGFRSTSIQKFTKYSFFPLQLSYMSGCCDWLNLIHVERMMQSLTRILN